MADRRKAKRLSGQVVKSRYTLEGGPLDGGTVLLSDPSTLPIRVHGQRGRYLGFGPGANRLQWTPADER